MDIIGVTKSPRWTPAALYHIGKLYQSMTDRMFEAPLPPWLTEDQKIIYKNSLDEKALNAQAKAVDAFEKAMKKGYETSVYNKWVKKAKYSLKYFQELRPNKYYDENEILPPANMFETSSLIGRVDIDIKFLPLNNKERNALKRKLNNPTAEEKCLPVHGYKKKSKKKTI